MPVNKDYSIVADSTLSSSPPIKRAAVTYGRRRDAIVDDPDSSLFNSAASSASQQSIYRTGPPDMDEEIPPSSEPAGPLSDHELADDEDEEDEGERDASPKFQFAWKQHLKALDEQDDFDIDLPSAPDCEDASGSDEALFEMSLVPESSKVVGNRTTPNSPVAAEHMSLSENVFDGSVSTLTGSSSQPPAAFNKAPSPLSPTVALARRRPNKRAIIHDSDSDSGHSNNPVSPRRPSSFLHPITTPKLHSSTPPTSDVEIPAQSESKKETKREKGKAVSSSHRRSVAPVQFEENHSSTAGGIAITNNKSIVKENRRKAKTKVKVRDSIHFCSPLFFLGGNSCDTTCCFSNANALIMCRHQQRKTLRKQPETVSASPQTSMYPFLGLRLRTRGIPSRISSNPSSACQIKIIIRPFCINQRNTFVGPGHRVC